LGGRGIDLSASGYGQMVGSHELGNERLVFHKIRRIFFISHGTVATWY